MVANHTSWLDILIFSALTPLSFVAKSEVATWPFFSTLAKLQRTVFVERTRRSATGEARDQIRDRLHAGDTLVLFPEGTSNDGNAVLPFKSALMGAVEARVDDGKGGQRAVRVQPVSTAYVGLHGLPMGRENRPLFAWYGDMELVPHLFEALFTGPLDVVVEFHPPMSVDEVGGRKDSSPSCSRDRHPPRPRLRPWPVSTDAPPEAAHRGAVRSFGPAEAAA